MTIFEKIIARQIRAKIIWEDDDALVFRDVNPQAPVHVLIVPKKVVPRLTDATDDDRALLGKLLLVARDMAKKLALSRGYRVVINCGPDAGESVPHLHVNVLGNRALAWPPGSRGCYRDKRRVARHDPLVCEAFQLLAKYEIG